MKISEEELVDQLKRSNEKAIYYLIDNYGGLMKSVINKNMYGLESYKEECMNDCILAVWENIESFDPTRSSFKNWLAGIAKYKSIDYLRKYARENSNQSLDDFQFESDESTSQRILDQEALEMVNGLLEELSPEDQLLFKRLFIDEDDMGQVSQELNMSRPLIYNRVSRGRKKLRRLVEGDEDVKKYL